MPKSFNFLFFAYSLSMDIFKKTRTDYGCLYPLQTFSKDKKIDLRKISFFIEANNRDNLNILQLLARDISGNVYDNTGSYSGRILITKPTEDSQTLKFQNGLFLTDNVEQVEDVHLKQYGYERSNVDMNDEYTRLMEAQAAFKACSSALSTINTLNSKSATQIASIT